MAAVELLFSQPGRTHPPVDLLFGEAVGTAFVAISVPLPDLGVSVRIANIHESVEISFALPGLTPHVEVDLSLGIPDWVTGGGSVAWREGVGGSSGVGLPWPPSEPQGSTATDSWRDGAPLSPQPRLVWAPVVVLEKPSVSFVWSDGSSLRSSYREPWGNAIPLLGLPTGLPWRDGAYLSSGWSLPWSATTPLLNALSEAWREAARAELSERFAWGLGGPSTSRTREPWRDGEFLESHGGPAIPPIIVPPPEPCYTPSGVLVFSAFAPASTSLFFVCEAGSTTPDATIVIPTKRVYAVFNTFVLRRVDTGHVFPCPSFSMSLDSGSYTWGFSAAVPRPEYDLLRHDTDGAPVEVEAVVNGFAYRFLVESITADRSFGSVRMLRIGGRGLSGALDLLSGTYNNAGAARTAAQLMDDVLAINGVSGEWTVDFQLEDWLVPAGAWAYTGTGISALQTIAGAAGGYLQPDPTLQTLYVLPKYPVAPWLWSGETPDYEVPAAVATQESIQWEEKPRFNRVFVSGRSQGKLCRVTREGTAGDVVAPMVTDDLILTAVPGRQRGLSILGDTGRIARVGLKMPVLPVAGIIPPGKLVRYVDGATTRLGLTRSVSVDVSQEQTRQTIELEVHE